MTQWRLYDYAASANCYKVRLALAQLGANYERVPVDIFDGDTLTDAYREINPARETPVLEVDRARPLAWRSQGRSSPTPPMARPYCPATGGYAPRSCAGCYSSRPR